MNLERFQNDMDIASTGDRLSLLLMTVRDFDITKKETVGYLIRGLISIALFSATAHKDRTPPERYETAQFISAISAKMEDKVFKTGITPQQINFMIDYSIANEEKLMQEYLTIMNDGTTDSSGTLSERAN